jgi:hypothetical protein
LTAWQEGDMSDSALSRSMRGSVYNIAVSAVTAVLGFGRSVLLMRLLAPDQFGFVTLALFFMTFLTPFSSFGIDSATDPAAKPWERGIFNSLCAAFGVGDCDPGVRSLGVASPAANLRRSGCCRRCVSGVASHQCAYGLVLNSGCCPEAGYAVWGHRLPESAVQPGDDHHGTIAGGQPC